MDSLPVISLVKFLVSVVCLMNYINVLYDQEFNKCLPLKK